MSNSNPSEPATSSLRTFRNPPNHELSSFQNSFKKNNVGDSCQRQISFTLSSLLKMQRGYAKKRILPSPLGCFKTPPLHFGSILTSTNPHNLHFAYFDNVKKSVRISRPRIIKGLKAAEFVDRFQQVVAGIRNRSRWNKAHQTQWQ